ncbi:MAG: serine hydrolase domain-containing protein [Longimicrobiales bacterium]
MQIETEPGTKFLYNPYNPIVLGLVLERATKMSLSEFLSAHVWQPMGMEGVASWSLDSKQHAFEKMESGFNARPRDLARLGLQYLNSGSWNRRRIVSENWVAESARADTLRDPAMNYQSAQKL